MKRKMIYTGVAIGAIGCCAMLGVGIHSALGTNVAAQTDRDDLRGTAGRSERSI